MNANPNIYEWIEEYLFGSLSEAQKVEFEKKMKEDALFAREVEIQKFVNEALLEKSLLDLKRKVGTDLSRPAISRWVWYVLIAVGAIAIATGIVYALHLHQQKNLIQDQIPVREYTTEKAAEGLRKPEEKDTIHKQMMKPSKRDRLTVPPPSIPLLKKDADVEAYRTDSASMHQLPLHATPAPVLPTIKSTNTCPDITFEVHTEPTCTGKAEGVVQVIQSSIKGGQDPYSYAFNSGEFTTQSLYNELPSGEHEVAVKDTKGCTSKKKVQVPQHNCIEEKDYAFNPQNETWKFPLETNENGSVKITNKNGRVVYESRIVNGSPSEWDGRTLYGEQLEINTYLYILQTDDGKLKRGYIVILR